MFMVTKERLKLSLSLRKILRKISEHVIFALETTGSEIDSEVLICHIDAWEAKNNE